jgi:3-phenylpropionate/cinnamic acid dioxygenase small subunit
VTLDELLLRSDVEAFLYLEARLADESRYDEWLALFDEEVHYWVPRGPANYDPATRVSYINDNRNRLETRIRQLNTGVRHAQTPASPMRRVVANVEVLEVVEQIGSTIVTCSSNFVLREHSIQATNELRTWAGRATHRLRRTDHGWRIAAKTVELVNSSYSLPTMAFLL